MRKKKSDAEKSFDGYWRNQCNACHTRAYIYSGIDDIPGMHMCHGHFMLQYEDPEQLMEDVRNKAIKKARRKGVK